MIQPYPWRHLGRVGRRDIGLLRWLSRARHDDASPPMAPGRAADGERIEVSFLPPRACALEELRERIGLWTTLVLQLVRGVEWRAYLTLPGRLVRTVGQREHRGPDISAPRPATAAERESAALVVTAFLRERYGLADVMVDVDDGSGAELATRLARTTDDRAPVPVIVVPVRVALASTIHLAHVIVHRDAIAGTGAHALDVHPSRYPSRFPSYLALVARRGERLALAPMSLPVIARCAHAHPEVVASVRPRDVMLFERVPDTGYLPVARGLIPIALQPGRVLIRGPYRRGNHMSELLFDDAMVEISCRLGHVSMSARQVLELEPGEVIAFDIPLGSPVDVMCGGAVIARGELLDVDGDVGVRILTTYERE